MPVAVRKTPFAAKPKTTEHGLRVPQARILQALMPAHPSDHYTEWPLLNRAALGIRAGYTAISGTITRALNGIHEGSSSGDPHPGLLARGLVKATSVDVDGVTEVNYRITAAGIREYEVHLAANGKQLPPVKDAELCTNDRYAEE